MNEKLHNRKYLKKYRRELKNNLTYSEARLWSCLRARKLNGRKFRRQHSIGNYRVDFFYFEENLVIEIDGTSHDDPSNEQNDEIRDSYLIKNGFKIIRIEAIDIMNNIDAVLNEISLAFRR